MTSSASPPACARRWREAPDEGLSSKRSTIGCPHPNPLPQEKGPRFSRLQGRIARPDDGLIEVYVRTRHQTGFARREIGAGASDFLRIDQPAERARFHRL